MPEDAKIFGECYELYKKYRDTMLEEDEDWEKFVTDVRNFAERFGWRENPLTKRLGFALLDVFSDMYRGGKKPAVRDYIGRGDL